MRFIKQAVTKDNYRDVLVPLLTAGGGQGFCVNLSVDTSSVDIMTVCQEIGALYIDTVIEPWLGFYFDERRSRSALRITRCVKHYLRPSTGARRTDRVYLRHPGMVSWFVKQALLDIARDTNTPFNDREGWASPLASRAFISPNATPSARRSQSRSTYWSPPGRWKASVSEGMQPAELRWAPMERGCLITAAPASRRRDLSAAGGCQYARAFGCPTRARNTVFPRHPQRGDFDRGLLHRA